MSTEASITNQPFLNAGWIIWITSTLVHNTSYGADHIPKEICELLITGGWRKFIVPYQENVVEYAADEFKRFAEAPPPRGLGQSLERLIAICEVAKTPEGEMAVRLLKAEHQALMHITR